MTEVPEGAKVVATNDFCENAALLYDDRMFTVQAHPEFPNSFVDGSDAHPRSRPCAR